MAIVVQHGPSAHAVGDVAYQGGYLQGRNKLNERLQAEENRRFAQMTQNAHAERMAGLAQQHDLKKMEVANELGEIADQRRAELAATQRDAERKWHSEESLLQREWNRASQEISQDFNREMAAEKDREHWERELYRIGQNPDPYAKAVQQKQYAISQVEIAQSRGNLTSAQYKAAMAAVQRQYPQDERVLRSAMEMRQADRLGLPPEQAQLAMAGQVVDVTSKSGETLPMRFDHSTGALVVDNAVLRDRTSRAVAQSQLEAQQAQARERVAAEARKAEEKAAQDAAKEQERVAKDMERRQAAVKKQADAQAAKVKKLEDKVLAAQDKVRMEWVKVRDDVKDSNAAAISVYDREMAKHGDPDRAERAVKEAGFSDQSRHMAVLQDQVLRHQKELARERAVTVDADLDSQLLEMSKTF